MKDPFREKANREKMDTLLDALKNMQVEVDSMRELLVPIIDGNVDGGECSCVHNELFDLDSLLFAIWQTLGLFGSGIVTHLRAINNHEEGKESANLEIVSAPIPDAPEDKGPGPNGAH